MSTPGGGSQATTAPAVADPLQMRPGWGVHEQKASARGQATVIQAAGSVITGNVFVGRFARLRDVWLDPTPVFEEVQVGSFVGREWLLEPLDRFLASHDHGYVIIQADAGLGKTAFAAWLAQSRDWPCHFTRRRKGRVAATALRNIAAQLIAQYQMGEQFAPGGMLPETAGEPGWFEQVLRTAAERARAAGQCVVIVVDGLDEAERVEGDLPLGLPAVLPRGAFIAATCRTGTNLAALRRPWKRISIEARDRHNMADLQRFLAAVVTEDRILASLLSSADVTADAFVARVLRRCGGVWVYLRYVLDELRLGLRSVEDIDELPADLIGYYTESLVPDGTDLEWSRLRLPLLATLAAAAEPLSVEVLTRLTGLPDRHPVYTLSATRLRPFLAASTDEEGTRRYSIYHASLREFLSGAGLGLLIEGDQARLEELARAVTEAHARIAGHYLTAFGGLLEGLPLLAADPSLAQQDDGYALRYLSQHLERAGRANDVHALLSCENPSGDVRGSVWYAAHDQAGTLADYGADVNRAYRLAAGQTDKDVELGRSAPSFGLELRYAIINSAVTTLAANVPAPLVARLVGSRSWSPTRGLFYARQVRHPGDRAAALAELAPHLPPQDRSAAIREAIETASQLTEAYERAWALTKLLTELPEPVSDQLATDALAATSTLTDDDEKAYFLTELAEYLHGSDLREAVKVATAIEDDEERAYALSGLIPHLPAPILTTVLAGVSDISDGHNRAQVLTALASRVPVDLAAGVVAAARAIPADDDRAWALGRIVSHIHESRTEILAEALVSARATTAAADRAWALSSLAEYLSGGDRNQLLDEALSAARTADETDQPWALSTVAKELPPDHRERILTDALSISLALPAEADQADSLATLAPRISGPLLVKAAAAVFNLESEHDRAEALASYAPYLSGQLLEQAFKAACAISNETQRGLAVRAALPHLPDHMIAEALAAARTFSSAYQRSRVIGDLANRLPDKLLGEALATVQSMTGDDGTARTLCQLAVRMQSHQRAQLMSEALTAARSAVFDLGRAQALAEIAPNLTGPSRNQVLSEAVNAAKAIPDEYWRAFALDHLIPHLDPPTRDQAITDALTTARSLPDDYNRAWRLSELARHLPEPDRAALIREAIGATRALRSNGLKALLLAKLAVHLPRSDRRSVLAEARTIARSAAEDIPLAGRVAANLVLLLPDHLLVKALRSACKVVREDDDALAGIDVLRYLPKSLLDQGLDALRDYTGTHARAQILGTIALYLPPPLDQKALDLVFDAPESVVARRALITQARSLWRESISISHLELFRHCLVDVGLDDCLNVLASGLDIVSRTGGRRALDDCLEAIRTVQRWWPTTTDYQERPAVIK